MGNEIVCITKRPGRTAVVLGREQKTRAGRGYGRSRHWQRDDPYFYGGYHYGGWGYYRRLLGTLLIITEPTAGDAADFTEADLEVLAAADIDMDAGEFCTDTAES